MTASVFADSIVAEALARARAVRPHGIKCGKCKQSHATVADVRSCYATCEHGLSADLCEGPQHYPYDAEEIAGGMGW
jgi:hypothetical protein